MGFVFVHTADWQIGRRFRMLPGAAGAALEEARLDSIDTLAQIAGAAQARHVLVAGDIFDAEDVAARTMRALIGRMGRHGGVTWWLLPGNHDPARPKGIWSRFASLNDGGPNARGTGNIKLLLDARPVEIDPGVALLPAPLLARVACGDPTAWMDGAQTPDGTFRIGLAHGSIKGFGSASSTNVPIDPQRAAKARLDYLALGDWHGTARVDARTWYSGTPEPDSFDGNDPGHALVVRLEEAPAPPIVERVATRRYLWQAFERVIAGDSDIEAITQLVCSAPVPPERQLLRLRLTGRIDAAVDTRLSLLIETLEATLRHAEIDRGGVIVRPHLDAQAVIDADPVLSGLAARLRAIDGGGDAARARAVAAALRKLSEIDRRYREAAE